MPLLCEKRGHVAILTLSRPEARNAWDEDFNEGLEAQLAELEHDHEIRCVILTGDEKGRAFSAGANLADTETHTIASPAAFITGIPALAQIRRQPADRLPQAGDRRGQRLCDRHRLHCHLLL
jgi:enoyl-CoA hydratase/carnithine racemase